MVGAPPPPPPPPPPPAPVASDGGGGGGEDVAAALFASINALGSEGARAGLKKATKGPVNADAPAPAVAAAVKPVVAPGGGAPKKTYPPKCQLSGNKWAVEHQDGAKELVVEVTSIKQSVYVYKCNKSTLQIKGKPNSICIDGCSKVDVIFENALSTCDIVNSKDVQMQCTGTAPSINIDGCVAVTCYLSAESFEAAHVITSKSAAINLIVPVGDDIKETPIPEQFLTKYVKGAWVTEAVSHDD